MKTLILKHGGHEAHVPYELPDSLRFDCFVPEMGIGWACVDVRSDTIDVVDSSGIPCDDPAVLEQAGDVCAVFERALSTQRLMSAQYTGRVPEHDVVNARVLSTIAEMALLESDLHTADLRLPEPVRDEKGAPPDPRTPDDSYAHHRLMRFIHEVLVPRAQDLATAAAKRREAEWVQDKAHEDYQSARWAALDLEIDLMKERA